MYKKIMLLLLLIFSFFILMGCIKEESPDGDMKIMESQPKKEEVDPIREKIEKMTLNEKIGQMVYVGFDGTVNNEQTREMIGKYHVGGFILFKRNIKDTNQTVALIHSLKETNSKNKIPLFFGIDEEGGGVSRMPKELKKIPTNKRIGQINNPDFSFQIGSMIGEQIKSLGFNMDFAPVLDINSNPKNPVIGDRSFGPNKEVVSKLGIQTMKGIQSKNIIPVVKHFPGHGDTSVDSHIGLPVVNYDLDRLKDFELVPFIEAINNGANAVMVAHILLPKIDPENPASLSKKIITDLLRKELNFEGVVITDDMTMGAIVKKYDIGEGAVKAINAGSDIVLVCHDYDKEVAVIEAMKSAVNSGVISEEKINESVYRILKLKEMYHLKDEKINEVSIEDINMKINSVLDNYLGD